MLGNLKTLLESTGENIDRSLSTMSILTEAERHRLLVEWNDTQRDYPKDRCIHEFFENQVESKPDSVAVVFEDQQLTYR
jgi:non-ribosomal peptide synthetase component F